MSRSSPRSSRGVLNSFPPFRPRQRTASRGLADIGASVVLLASIVAVGIMVAWPRLKPRRATPRQIDPVERVASDYLKAISTDDSETIKRLGTVEEPPAIRLGRSVTATRAATASSS